MGDNTTNCTNCEAQFDQESKFCPNCGQKNIEIKLRFKDFISEFFSANFNLNSKIFISLKLSLFKPAFLAKEFLSGKRTKYIPPVRLFLFINLIYFFFLFLDVSNVEAVEVLDSNNTQNEVIATLHEDTLINSIILEEEGDSTLELNSIEQYLNNKIELFSTEAGMLKFKNNFKKYASTGMLILLPFIAFIFFLLFYKNSYYVEHLTFVISLQTSILLYGTLFIILGFFVDSAWVIIIELLFIIVLTFLWTRNFYNLSIKRTLYKLLIFFFSYGVLIIIYLLFLLAMSIIFI
ncbi:MAG: hypothetical protein DRI86_00815 [Bacteroidetes bacterium]|nr:MAG: hypothetical protein DRI86_00815 [Bacteroidota bacterium]